MITHIYFDWSGTLARSGTKKILMDSTKKEKLATLYADTFELLEYLTKKGYKIGIISNSSKPPRKMHTAFKEMGIDTYLTASVIFANAERICRKPCKTVFQHVLKRDHVKPENAVMIGNDYEKDIEGGMSVDMQTIFIDRTRPCSENPHVHSLSQIMKIL